MKARCMAKGAQFMLVAMILNHSFKPWQKSWISSTLPKACIYTGSLSANHTQNLHKPWSKLKLPLWIPTIECVTLKSSRIASKYHQVRFSVHFVYIFYVTMDMFEIDPPPPPRHSFSIVIAHLKEHLKVVLGIPLEFGLDGWLEGFSSTQPEERHVMILGLWFVFFCTSHYLQYDIWSCQSFIFLEMC